MRRIDLLMAPTLAVLVTVGLPAQATREPGRSAPGETSTAVAASPHAHGSGRSRPGRGESARAARAAAEDLARRWS